MDIPGGPPAERTANLDGDEQDGIEEEQISIGLTEDGSICVEGEEFELWLSPAEARDLAQALLDYAAEAERGAA